MKPNKSLRVAIVHDWFVGGGAEMVVFELHKLYPDAPIYTSYCSAEWRSKLYGAKIITSYMQHWPFYKLRKFLPVLRQHWFSRLDFSDFDLVISSSGAEAKGIHTPKNVMHINYCHAPTHYYWNRYDTYLESPGFGLLDPLARLGLKLLVKPMRKWDLKAAQRPNYLIANSTFTAAQIKKYYERESTVIYPPVDTESFKPNSEVTRNGFVITGRQVPYKRFDLAIAACTKLSLPLTVVGDGPQHSKLKKLAGPTIKFTGYISGPEVVSAVQSAEAFIFPCVDDFGISPITALAAGTPVIAFKGGGALDYVEPGKTGEFFDNQTVESLCEALNKFSAENYDSNAVAKSAEKFGKAIFAQKIQTFINEKIGK